MTATTLTGTIPLNTQLTGTIPLGAQLAGIIPLDMQLTGSIENDDQIILVNEFGNWLINEVGDVLIKG